MHLIAKVVYPPPPPTSNNLTPKQRSLLLRKAKKIEQLMGCPPHVVDTDYTNRPLLPPAPIPTTRSSRFSVRSSRSSSTFPRVSDTDYTITPILPIRPSTSSRFSIRSARSSSTFSPLLSSGSLYLDVTDATPSIPSWPTKPVLSISPSDLRYPSDDAPKIQQDLTAISGVNGHRKAKMDRIRKILGPGVPLELVFPPDLHVTSKQDDLQEVLPPGNQNSVCDEWLNRPLPALPTLPDSSSKHSRRGRPPFTIVVADFKPADGKLSLIAECSDEPLSDPRLNSPLSLRSSKAGDSDRAYHKRPSSYRKPPPPIPDDLKALDLK